MFGSHFSLLFEELKLFIGHTLFKKCSFFSLYDKANFVEFLIITLLTNVCLMLMYNNKRFEFKKLVGRLRPWKLESLGNRRY